MASEDHEVIVKLTRIETLLNEWHKTHEDHETRIRKLERSLWLAMGAAAVGGGGIASFIQHLT